MTDLETLNSRNQFTYIKKLTVRAWWADGLWDFVMAGFYILLAVSIYFLTFDLITPGITPPWPFNLQDPHDPWQKITLGWMLGSLVIIGVYMYLTYLLVKLAKQHWIAPITGDVRHTFWLPVETRAALMYVGIYILLSVGLIFINDRLFGGSRVLSVFMITAPAAIFFSIGQEYWLRRYILLSIVGLLFCLAFEWLLAGYLTANLQALPAFLRVSNDYGNPIFPLLIWAVLLIVSGFYGLNSTLRGVHASGN
ncbi:MAG: hypothetical protein LWX83_04480 [Anaerolineae bacterium]|nr:hypothetical protein [Anaerolineae bacterium]